MPKPTSREFLDTLVDEIAESILATPPEELSEDDTANPAEIRAAMLEAIDSVEHKTRSSVPDAPPDVPSTAPLQILRPHAVLRPTSALTIRRHGARMTCPAPMALASDRRHGGAAGFVWSDDRVLDLALGQPLPRGYDVDSHGNTIASMVVTLGPQAQLANLHGYGQWATIFAMPPRETQLVVTRTSGLADLRDTALGVRLRGKYIAVTDRRSIFALKLSDLCRYFGIVTNILSRSTHQRRNRRSDEHECLNLVEMPPDSMVTDLNRGIDGFAAGEPYPSIAVLEHGFATVAYATVSVSSPAIPVETPFCCVTLVDQRLLTNHPLVYSALVQEMVNVLLNLATGNQDTCKRLFTLIRGYGWAIKEPAVELAAAKTIRHVAGHIKDGIDHYLANNQPDKIGLIVQPEITMTSLREELAIIRTLDPKEAEWARSHVADLESFDLTALYNPLAMSRQLLTQAIIEYGATRLLQVVDSTAQRAQQVIDKARVA